MTSPQLVTRRLGRSRRYLAEIVNYARDLKIPVHRINGAQSIDKVGAEALAAIHQFTDEAGEQ